jgi:hypothetical protein
MTSVQTQGTGSINGSPLNQGDSITLTVKSGDDMAITASTGAQVTITNNGASTVSADCAI